MTKPLKLRPLADLDWAEHFDYLADRSPAAARRFYESIEESLVRIRADPDIGMRIELLGHEGDDLRALKPRAFPKYLIFYWIREDAVYILRILHSAQEWKAILKTTN